MISPGLRIGRYEIGKRLGKGAFGVVHLARDVDLDREVAIKVLKAEFAVNAQIVQRFLKEARAAAKIGHAGIVTVYEVGQIQGTNTRADGNAYIAMELLVGESLTQRLVNGRMSPDQATTITRQLAAALGAAHAAGIVHRDLKPDNVFLIPDAAVHGGERVKILDFGVAKLAEGAGVGENTHSKMMIGTPKYMAPEQARSAAKVDHRADIYGLGCMLFEMMTGLGPFRGDAADQIIAHQQMPPPSARDVVSSVPSSIDTLISRMLAKDPNDRPQTMTDVVDALVDLGDEPETVVRRPIESIESRTSAEITAVGTLVHKRKPEPAQNKVLLVAIAFAAMTVSAIIVFIMMRQTSSSQRPRIVLADAAIDAVEVVAQIDEPIEIDASTAVVDRSDNTSLRCREAADKRKWAQLILCAEELRKIDREKGDALYKAGHEEEKAEVHYRNLENAIAEDEVKKAKDALESISPESVYRKDAEKRYDEFLAAKEGKPKNPPSKDPPPKDPPQDPSGECDAQDLFNKGRDAFSGGRNNDALAAFEASNRCKADPNTQKFVFASACRAGAVGKAKSMWKKMPQAMKDATLNFCVSAGLTVDVLNAP